MDFVRLAVWLAPSKKKRRRRGGELVEVPQTILVLALFLFSIIEMNWILRAEKECAVGGSCGVRIVSFCVSSPFFWSKWSNKYMRDRHKRTSALWMSVCVRERVPGCLHSLSCSLCGALSMSGSTYWSNSEPEWLSWLQGQSRKAAHKKKDRSPLLLLLCFNVLFFCCRCKPWPCGGFGIRHFICHMPFLPPNPLIFLQVCRSRGWKREVKKKNRKKRWCWKDWAARGG